MVDAHRHSSNHRHEIDTSNVVGCFYCCESYLPTRIDEWVDDNSTAMCPKCGIDSVIGDASGYTVSDEKFLNEMNRFWFS